MPISVHFAHVADLHISDRGDAGMNLGAQAPHLLHECFTHLNAMDDLDFVLLTGDLLDTASASELDRLLEVLPALHKPWHFVAGNHDGFYDHRNPDVLTPEYVVAAIDQRLANPTPVVQQALWSREVAPGVQMIGMDSRIKEDWSGYVGEAQLEWLRQQLDAHRDQLVLIAVHHPLSPLTSHNSRPWWDKFICRNGEEVSQMLDGYPNVKMVISGHHHANRILNSNGRLHITTAALGGYPCIYRTVRLSQTDDGWRTSIQVHTVADPITLERARALMRTSYPARDYIPNAPDAYLTLCEGAPSDQVFDGLIP